MRLIVTGSRSWDDAETLRRELDLAVTGAASVTLVCGMARGADRLAWQWAIDRGHDRIPFWPRWNQHPYDAGKIRNQEMADAGGDLCVAFLCPCERDGCLLAGIHPTHGADDMTIRAEKAHITVNRVYQKGWQRD